MKQDKTEQPNKIGRYQVLDTLGKGAMGHVYLGYDPNMKRQVAIKLLSYQQTFDGDALARFQREAEIVANLEHASIVPVYDSGEHERQPYIVMQYMGGGALKERIEEQKMSLEEMADIVDRVALGLDVAHKQGVIHRDLKPANILFDERGNAYLADFGIAKLRADFAQQLTGNVVLGTPEFMSPEQVRGTADLDGRSDVYALGIMLFYALTRVLPFRAHTPMGTAIAHLMDPIPKILSHRADLPEEMNGLMVKALAKKVEERYQAAGDLARSLRLVADGRGYLLRIADL